MMHVLSTEALLDGLTAAQREAVVHMDGPLLVLAGPGSGKTRVITLRVAHLIANGIPPWQILALTFTNKAAGEMRERIDRILLPETSPTETGGRPNRRGLTVATFHSFCALLLRRFAEPAGLSPRFSIYATADQRDAVKKAMDEAEVDSKNFTPASVLGVISNAKNSLMDAVAYASHAHDFYTKKIASIFKAYERILTAASAVDFDDLLLITAKLLKQNADVRRQLQDRYQYILIDEYQDTNHAQFLIANTLAGGATGGAGNICVVGDPDQSIYGWRGADIANILEFEEHYPKAKVVALGQNFRSTGYILKAASALIRHNKRRKHKDLFTDQGDGEKPQLVICRDEQHEAELVVDEFKRRHEGDRTRGEAGIAWKDMAVLYRVNALSRVMEAALRNAQVPYVIARGTAFYERKEVNDALAYLRVVANPNDDVALRRIINTPTRGIGKTSLERLELLATQRGLPLLEAMRHAAGPDGSADTAGLGAKAAAGIRRLVQLFDAWRNEQAAQVDDGMLAFGANTEEGIEALASLVERVISESGLEAMYAAAKGEEEEQRVENLRELVSAAAQFKPAIDEEEDGEDFADESPAAFHDGWGEGGFADDMPPPVPHSSHAPSGRKRTGRSPQSMLTLFLESIALTSDADAIDPANGAVTLLTLHAAKGLEFDVVALIGLEQGLLPHSRAETNENELEEERRLCFVGMTRARRHLMMTRAVVRTHRGLRDRTIPSAFIEELPREAIHLSEQADEGFDSFTEPRAVDFARRSMRLQADEDALGFPVGCLVRHAKFGLGRIESVMPRATGASAIVKFNTVGMKTLVLQYANLERVQ